MDTKENISKGQFAAILFNTSASTLVMLHATVLNISGRGAWISETVGYLLLIPFGLWTMYLAKLSPGKTILGLLEICSGKLISKLVSIIYTFAFIILAIITLRLLLGIVRAFVLFHTPTWIVSLIILVVSFLITLSGIEVLARMNVVLVVVLISSFFITVLLSMISLSNLDYISPILEKGLKGIALGTLVSGGASANCIVFLPIVVAYLPKLEENYSTLIKSLLVTGILFGIGIFNIICTLSAEIAKNNAYGIFNVARSIQIGTFIQGSEIFVFFVYSFLLFSYLPAYMYGSWSGIKQIFNNCCPIVFLSIIAIIIFIMVLTIDSYNEAYFIAELAAKYVTLPLVFLLLLVTSIAAFINRNAMVKKAK